MDGFMDIGHQKGGQEGKEKGEVRKGEERGGWDATLSGILLYWTPRGALKINFDQPNVTLDTFWAGCLGPFCLLGQAILAYFAFFVRLPYRV